MPMNATAVKRLTKPDSMISLPPPGPSSNRGFGQPLYLTLLCNYMLSFRANLNSQILAEISGSGRHHATIRTSLDAEKISICIP
jgi:hypothetical protein